MKTVIVAFMLLFNIPDKMYFMFFQIVITGHSTHVLQNDSFLIGKGVNESMKHSKAYRLPVSLTVR